MHDRLLRCAAALAGVLVIGAATRANVLHAGGYHTDSAPLIIALAALLAVGLAFAALSYRNGWRLFAVLLGVCLVCGEAYWVLINLEREIAERETRLQPILDAQIAHKRAEERVADAERVLQAVPETSPRLERALAGKEKADQAVLAKSAEDGCRVNCAALLQSQVDQWQADIEAARAELAAAKAAAQAELADARQDLKTTPRAALTGSLSAHIGMAPWAWDLILAALRSLGIVGGSIAIGLALHPSRAKAPAERTQQRAAAEMAQARARSQALETTLQPIVRRRPKSRRDHVAGFLERTIVQSPGSEMSLKALSKVYREQFSNDALPTQVVARELRALFETMRLKTEFRDGDIIVHGAAIREQIAPPRTSAA